MEVREHTLPVALEAERAILGAILMGEAAYDEAANLGLKAEDFSLDSHRRLYRVVVEMREAGQPIDLVTLCAELRERKDFVAIGGDAFVSSLLDGLPDRPSIRSYVKMVRDKAKLRAVIHACNATIAQAEEGSSKSQECAAALGDKLLEIQADCKDVAMERITAFTDEILAKWNKLADSTELLGLTTGLEHLDDLTTGIRPGELWAIGGRQGDGKTALALQIAAANIRKDIPVGIFSVEMSRDEVLQRLWAQEPEVRFRFNQVRDPRNLPADVRKRITSAACEVGWRPLFICDDGSLSIQKLLAKARILIRREKIKLFIVDYTQFVGAVAQNERERISKVSNALRALAKDYGVPVIALNQLVKPKDYNPNQRPNRYSFRESSAIADDSHVCLLIYRPVYDENDERAGQYTGRDEVIIDKSRNGPRDLVRVEFVEDKLMFRERTWCLPEKKGKKAETVLAGLPTKTSESE